MVHIYGLVCPFSGEIRYIGKTIRNPIVRMRHHLAEARKKSSSHKLRWLRKCMESDLSPTVWVLEEVEEGDRWQDRERAWISRALNLGYQLVNQTKGGEGLDYRDGHEAEAHKARKREIGKRRFKERPELKAALVEGCKNHWQECRAERLAALESSRTDDWLEKVRQKNREIAKRPEVRKKWSARSKSMWVSDREKLIASFNTAEVHKKHVSRAKRSWSDPDTRTKMMNRWTPEAREAQAQRIRDRAKDPAYRRLMAEKTRARWERAGQEAKDSACAHMRAAKKRIVL